MATLIPVDVVEALMGHEGYLTEVYRRYTQEDLAKFYLQGESSLLVFTEAEEVSRLRVEVEERNKQLQTLANGLASENLESFFKMADPNFRFAVEFRNLSWMRDETWSLLKEYEVAYVNVDEPLLPPEVHLTTDFAYFRWHGRGEKPWFDYLYEKTEIDEWVPKVEDAAKNVKKVYGYFNNHFHGYAPENCLYLIEKLGLLSEEQKRAKQKASIKQSQLGSFFQ